MSDRYSRALSARGRPPWCSCTHGACTDVHTNRTKLTGNRMCEGWSYFVRVCMIIFKGQNFWVQEAWCALWSAINCYTSGFNLTIAITPLFICSCSPFCSYCSAYRLDLKTQSSDSSNPQFSWPWSPFYYSSHSLSISSLVLPEKCNTHKKLEKR